MILSKLFRAYENDMHIQCDHRLRASRRQCTSQAQVIVVLHQVDQCNEPTGDRNRIMLRCTEHSKLAVLEASSILARKRAEAYDRAKHWGGRRRATCNTCGKRLTGVVDICTTAQLLASSSCVDQ